MTDCRTFATREDAETTVARLLGWEAEPVEVTLEDRGQVWVIACREEDRPGQDLFLRSDGWVR